MDRKIWIGGLHMDEVAPTIQLVLFFRQQRVFEFFVFQMIPDKRRSLIMIFLVDVNLEVQIVQFSFGQTLEDPFLE